jgi:hypothetical protein
MIGHFHSAEHFVPPLLPPSRTSSAASMMERREPGKEILPRVSKEPKEPKIPREEAI